MFFSLSYKAKQLLIPSIEIYILSCKLEAIFLIYIYIYIFIIADHHYESLYSIQQQHEELSTPIQKLSTH